MLVRTVLSAGFALFLAAMHAISSPIALADGPAVSAPNAKVSVEGGELNSESAVIGLGSVTLPVTHGLGFQLDGAVGEIDDETIWGARGAPLYPRSHALPLRCLRQLS